jgi:hypothetical protein
MDSMRVQLPPQTHLSASNSQDHLQRLSSSGALPGATPMLAGGHSSAFAVARPTAGSISASPRATIGGNSISDAFHSGSYGACGSFGAAPTGSSIFSAQSIDSRLGSLDMALMGSRPAAPASASTSGGQRMHNLANECTPAFTTTRLTMLSCISSCPSGKASIINNPLLCRSVIQE